MSAAAAAAQPGLTGSYRAIVEGPSRVFYLILEDCPLVGHALLLRGAVAGAGVPA